MRDEVWKKRFGSRGLCTYNSGFLSTTPTDAAFTRSTVNGTTWTWLATLAHCIGHKRIIRFTFPTSLIAPWLIHLKGQNEFWWTTLLVHKSSFTLLGKSVIRASHYDAAILFDTAKTFAFPNDFQLYSHFTPSPIESWGKNEEWNTTQTKCWENNALIFPVVRASR